MELGESMVGQSVRAFYQPAAPLRLRALPDRRLYHAHALKIDLKWLYTLQCNPAR